MGSIKSKLQSNAVGVALNVMATIAFVILALTSWRRVGFVLSGVAFAGLSWRALTKGFGETITGQLLIAGGLLVEYHRARSGFSAVPVVIAGALLALLIVNQPLLETVINRPAMVIANLPGYQPVRRVLIEPKLVYSSTLVLIVVLSAGAYASWSAWPLVGLAVLATAAVAVDGLQALHQRLRGSLTEKQFRTALEAYDPAFALYFSAPDDTEYHVTMWLPYLERIGKPVRRHPARAAAVRQRSRQPTSVPVVYCPCSAVRRPGRHARHEGVLLRQQRREEQSHGAVQPADPHPAAARRQRQGVQLQPGDRDVRPDLRGRPGRHRPVRGQRRAHPAARSSTSSGARRSRRST